MGTASAAAGTLLHCCLPLACRAGFSCGLLVALQPPPTPPTGLISALHRVDATGLLGGLARGEGLPGNLSQSQLLAWLDTSCSLPGLELLAAECAARIVNGMHSTAGCFPAGGLTLAGSTLAGLPLEQLAAPALALLCRAALAVVGDAQGRQARCPSQRSVFAPHYVQQLGGEQVAVMSLPAAAGAHTWRHATVLELTAQPIESPPFRWVGACSFQRPANLRASRRPTGSIAQRRAPSQHSSADCSLICASCCTATAPPPLRPPSRALQHWRLRMAPAGCACRSTRHGCRRSSCNGHR